MTDSIEPLSAQLADRYRVERELGAGGMATVYRRAGAEVGAQPTVVVLDAILEGRHERLGVSR